MVAMLPVTAPPATGAEARAITEAERVLRENTAYLSCDESHFIYGVAYIDGSYVESIFYVDGDGDRPAVTVRFRGDVPAPYGGGDSGADLPPLPFVLEIRAPRALQATPDGDGWRIDDAGWQHALRFKYTSWYGEIRRENGDWKIEWKGYRRPMLPASVTGRHKATCAMFDGR